MTRSCVETAADTLLNILGGAGVRVIAWCYVVLTLGCGGQASTSPNGSSSGGHAAERGVGPIDPIGLPTELPNQCEGALSTLHLTLPCKVGNPLSGAPTSSGDGSSVVECYDSSERTALSFTVPFAELPELIDLPVRIPFEGLPVQPNVGLVVDGAAYTGLLTGTAVFSRVDPTARAFVAQLSDATITWTRSDKVAFTCPLPATQIWAVAGDFL